MPNEKLVYWRSERDAIRTALTGRLGGDAKWRQIMERDLEKADRFVALWEGRLKDWAETLPQP